MYWYKKIVAQMGGDSSGSSGSSGAISGDNPSGVPASSNSVATDDGRGQSTPPKDPQAVADDFYNLSATYKQQIENYKNEYIELPGDTAPNDYMREVINIVGGYFNTVSSQILPYIDSIKSTKVSGLMNEFGRQLDQQSGIISSRGLNTMPSTVITTVDNYLYSFISDVQSTILNNGETEIV
jgi:hypothetical protein